MMLRTHYVSDAISQVGNDVTLAGWIHEVRDIGKIKFILLRDRTGIMQVTAKQGAVPDAVSASMVHPKETVVQVKGKVVESRIASGGVELIPSELTVLGEITTKVPFELTGKVPAELDVRLDHRYVDLRRAEPSAIFRLKSEIIFAFRDKLRTMGFQEIHPTCIVAAATEGGTNLFPVQYFERQAYLAQSPQLYKQLAVIGGMDKVFMTMPVFRAEKHNTLAHLNEVLQMDIEMGFADHNDAMDVLEAVFLHILSHAKKNCAKEFATLNTELVVPEKIPRYTYTQLIDALSSAGHPIKWGDDFDRDAEAKVCEIMKTEAYFITEWPTEQKAFYAMPKQGDELLCNAYDLIYRGMEISSGSQRVHDPEVLVKQLQARNLNPADFEFYINAFRVGAPPHAGWSIGLERIAMKMAGLSNIRETAMFPRDRMRLTP